MTARRQLPTDEARDLLALTREIATKELAPRSAEAEATETFPRDVFRMLGQAGLLALPYPEEYGGGGSPTRSTSRCSRRSAPSGPRSASGSPCTRCPASAWPTTAPRSSRQRWLPDMLGGELLGAYCLSEPHAGSDPAAMRTTARRDGDEYVINGAKAWTTHGGHADFYKVMARTGDEPQRHLLLPGARPTPRA